MPVSSAGFGGRGGETATQPLQGSDNPRLLHPQFPFLTQWPLAVRADLRALVKSADSSLAGGQRHLGLAENTSLRGLGENQQPEERSSQPSRERLRAGRTLGIVPHKGSITPHPQQGCRGKEGTPEWQNTLPAGTKLAGVAETTCPVLGTGASAASVPTRAALEQQLASAGAGRAGRRRQRLARLLRSLFKNR